VIDVSVLVGSQVRDAGTGRTGRISTISLPWVRVAWNQDPMFLAVESVYARSDPKIWTDFELFTLNGGWVSMGSILGSRPRGRVAQFTEDIESLLKDDAPSRIEIPDEPTRVSYREVRKGPFRGRQFDTRLEALEFVNQLLNAEYEEIRWQMDSMEEDWEVELTGLFQVLAEGCQACAEKKLESITGTDLFKRPRGERESKAEEWDCSEDGECVHMPSGFSLRFDAGE
jgi:hypothetical protein